MTFVFCTTFALTNLTIYADSFIGNLISATLLYKNNLKH